MTLLDTHAFLDPFDRMLIAQAGYENIPVVSTDVQFDACGVARIW
jgi:PIN domain nuclease of toxin-antitoxin system